MANKKEPLIEIARSYSRKVNTGDYSNIDIFCSAKQEVPEKEIEEVSAKLYSFCQQTVEEDVLAYQTRTLGGILTDEEKHTNEEKAAEVKKLEEEHRGTSMLEQVKAEQLEVEQLPIIDKEVPPQIEVA